LRLLAQLPGLLALSTRDRALLTLRLPSLAPGQAQGPGTLGERTGFTARGQLRHLVPSQWALPAQVQAWRMAHGGLLYRARSDKEPPQLPPMVLVLDCSPCCFGHTETLVRSAAFALGRFLLEAGQRPYLVVATATAAVHQLGERQDLVTILTVRSAAAGKAAPALQTAAALREKLRAEHPQEPVILLLTHPWFGAEEAAPQLMVPRLRGLFVRYPKHETVPVLGPRCERYIALSPHDSHRLGQALAELLA
jgi:ATP-dependent Clp protease ATP-binding subunit ClpC